jgi:hypothetical protein
MIGDDRPFVNIGVDSIIHRIMECGGAGVERDCKFVIKATGGFAEKKTKGWVLALIRYDNHIMCLIGDPRCGISD